MIPATEIHAVAADLSLDSQIVEKDYVLGWLLAGIYHHPELADAWTFKGGTCLKKCYFETYRFSEDLDFTLAEAAHLDATFLTRVFTDVASWVYDETGITVPADRLRFETFTNPRGGLSCEGRVYYNGPLQRTRSIPRIKLDLTADELLVLPAVERPVGHPYSDLPAEGIVARCYAYEELFAEKVRALGERTRPRDLYDVINLFRHGEFRPAVSTLMDVLRQKCEFKKTPVPTLAALSGSTAELTADWEAMLGHQLPVLPPFDSFWDVLPEFFTWLEGTPLAIPPSVPVASGERILRPPVGYFRLQRVEGSSALETIRFAGANRLCVDLDYINEQGERSVRTIEPYSLRRTRDDHIVLKASRVDTGQARSYRLDRIRSARVTDRTFVPRFAIELSAIEEGAQSFTPRTTVRPRSISAGRQDGTARGGPDI
ncbi:MAG: nucleotidyl transferase AbiEii/AbiGii toxin family protein [Vicinamibacterales bacterium]